MTTVVVSGICSLHKATVDMHEVNCDVIIMLGLTYTHGYTETRVFENLYFGNIQNLSFSDLKRCLCLGERLKGSALDRYACYYSVLEKIL